MNNKNTAATKTLLGGDLYRRLMFLLLALVVYRIGAHIPVPGINSNELKKLFDSQSGGILSMFNLFSGGALSRFTIFALGIMPYISASIIMQLVVLIVPKFEALKKEGQAGQKKVTQYTRYATVFLALIQSFSISVALLSQQNLVVVQPVLFQITAVVSLVTGTLFLMWLGEQITERGLGNGISMIILGGIISGLPTAISQFFDLVGSGSINTFPAILIIAIAIFVTAFVVFMERAQRKILINYAKRQVGNKVYGGQASHLPLKLNMAGVVPPIFASSIILFPSTIMSWLTSSTQVGAANSSPFIDFVRTLSINLSPGHLLYVVLYAAAIIFFCFFYTALVFNSKETAENLKKMGAFVPGIRPGIQTAGYIDSILSRLTIVGAIYMVLVCLLPEFLVLQWKVPFYFGGTSLLIIVVVTMDLISQVQSYVVSQQYGSLMKKNNFR
jgi:preprotein translocase subunit SecY